jgi:tetrapyrrole methylase family protein/MazG family protein
MATLTIVGLGPGDPGLLTLAAQQALAAASTVILRTARHPGVDALPAGPSYASCDDLYESMDSFEAVYDAIVQRVLASAARDGAAVYAVPGDPLVAEATVTALLQRAHEAEVDVRVVSGVSYVEPVLRLLAVDPLDAGGLQLCDALALSVEPARPALIAQLHNRRVASTLKLALLDLYPPAHTVTLVSAAGVPSGESVVALPLMDVDRNDLPDHLSTLYVPALSETENRRSFGGLRAIAHRLYAPGGCPWDREQTHQSLKKHLLEECYEALQALDDDDPQALCEELGDVLLQILLHTEIADEAGEFGYGDLFEGLASKLIRRHPHVFGDTSAASAEEVMANWQQLKAAEKAQRAAVAGGDAAPESILAGVPRAMPALAYAQAVQDRAARAGFDWPAIDGVLDKVAEEAGELRRAATPAERLDELGDLLFVLANLARWLGVDAEESARRAGAKFSRRFQGVEELARAANRPLGSMTLDELDALWDRVKAAENTPPR